VLAAVTREEAGEPTQNIAIPAKICGTRWTIVHCKGALESLELALRTLKADKQRSMINGLKNQLERHANGHPMAEKSFENEGLLPPLNKGKKARHFKAYKRLPIRAYCWQSPGTRDTWFISHYITKRRTKLTSADTTRVGDNYTRIEIDGEHC